MTTPLTITLHLDSPVELDQAILRFLANGNEQAGFPRNAQVMSAALRNPENAVEGGVKAQAFWGWLYIEMISVSSRWQGHGFGRRLLASAEDWGRSCGCTNAWVMTMSFQARGFYEKAGYSVFAELPNYPDDHSRYFLRKSLGSA